MIVGVLLAAGTATRFGGDKLLAELSAGQSVVEAACTSLRPAVDRLIVVVRPSASELAASLAAVGAEVRVCADAWRGMGASLAHGVAQAAEADGWLIALGDMPLVASADVLRIAAALRAGAAIAVPVASGRRGHPVGFARRFGPELAALDGDEGARALLARYPKDIVEVPVSDARTWHDVDTGDDLEFAKHLFNGT
jgi:molybdenum cofactor cytidylyltransferase